MFQNMKLQHIYESVLGLLYYSDLSIPILGQCCSNDYYFLSLSIFDAWKYQI